MPFGDSIGAEWAWVIPALSASAFFLVVVFGRFLPGQGSFISILAILLGFVLFWYVLRDLLVGGPASFSLDWLTVGNTRITWGVAVDRLSVAMLGLVTFVALLVQVYSLEYMRGQPRIGWYFAAHALFAAAMLALVLADNLLFLYISWELVGLGSYLLIGFWYERRSAAEAAKKAFITTRIGDVGLLIGIILLFKATGTFEISTIFHIAEESGISQTTVNIAAFLIFLGAMGKSAQFPFHVWLPDAMEGPTPVSALIHAATMVAAGVYLVARMLPLFELAPNVLLIVAGVGLFTFVFAGTLALVMTDIKRVLAYSTISHLGLMMLSLGAFGLAAAIFHLIVHGVAKALLFLGAGSVMHGLNEETDIWKMGGLRRRMPITALTFVIGAAALAGIAPLSGFFSKDEVLLAVLENRNPVFIAIALAAVVLSALYMARVVFVVFFGKLRAENERAHDSSAAMTVPLLLLAFLALGVGLLAFDWPGDYQGFGEFLAGEGKFHLEPWLTALSLALAVGGVAIGWLVYVRAGVSHRSAAERFPAVYRILVNKYYVDEVYQWTVNRVVLVLGNFVGDFRPHRDQRHGGRWFGPHGHAVRAAIATRPDRTHVQLRNGDGPGRLCTGAHMVGCADLDGHLRQLPAVHADNPASRRAGLFMALPGSRPQLIMWAASLIALVVLLLSFYAFLFYDHEDGGLQFTRTWQWLELEGGWPLGDQGITLTLGIDGIAAPMILLTGVVMFTGVLMSWTIADRGKDFFVLYFMLLSGVFGVFVSLDMFFLFFFYELAVLPMYLLIGIWGSSTDFSTFIRTKEYGAMKLMMYLVAAAS